jgi:hypothetical protein
MSNRTYHTTLLGTDTVSASRNVINANVGNSRLRTVTHYTTGPQTLAETADIVTADLTAGAFTVNLPATPTAGDTYELFKVDASGNALTIGRNGKTINGAAADSTIGTQWARLVLTWAATANTWLSRA